MSTFAIFISTMVLLTVAMIAFAMRGNYDNGSFTLIGLIGGFTIGCIVGVSVF